MATWGELKEARPDLAEHGARLLKQYAVAMAFIATLRKDGAPRLHPCCPALTETGLYVFIPHTSPKLHDLSRDPRYALHTFLPEEGDEEFYVAGKAARVDDPDVRAAMVATHHYAPPADEAFFELSIERALHTTWENWATPETRPIYEKWQEA